LRKRLIMVVFKDKSASFGKPKLVDSEKTTIPARSPSRSLASHTPKKDRTIRVEILDNGYMILDFHNVIGDRAKISRTHALKLAKYIISVYERRKLNNER